MRIAMWSGPRNLSTALMYSFASRGDCAVWDEPFYGAYIAQTGLDHPMCELILSSTETDSNIVAEQHLKNIPEGKAHYYFKEMTHHFLPGMPRDWFTKVSHVFLIRHPEKVIASYLNKRENPTESDIGFAQQARLFDEVYECSGNRPIVVDADRLCANPEYVLSKLCDLLGISFTKKMLSWPAGGHKSDGPWASHWYGNVWKSTEFREANNSQVKLENQWRELCDQALPYYKRLKTYAI